VRLDDVRQAVLLDMAFNLGPEPFDHDGIKDWPMFIKQVETGRYAEALRICARRCGQASWQAAERLASMMESGKWPSDVPNV